MVKLKIPNNIFEQMVEHARAEAPIEGCGILAGKDGVVEKFYKMTNVDKSKTHFTMVPEEQFAVVKDIRAAGLEMLAIYHSHPETPARPSKEDIRMALTPDVLYVIVSLVQPEKPQIKAFKILEDNITEADVAITKG